jgi:hypothetical protein
VATKSKAQIAEEARARGLQPRRYSPEQFCFRQDLSPSKFRKLQLEGKGPKLDADGKITDVAEDAWMRLRAEEAEARSATADDAA